VPLFAAGDVEWPELAVSEADHFHQRQAVRDGRYKLIRSKGAGDELYDLATDPGEQHDLAERARARSTGLTERMRAVLGSEAPMRARPLTEVERERLRALGYVD
jgi:arylsulfatase A-like enzyme